MNANGSLSLGQRKLVQKEIATEYRAWKKKLRREPDENERRQIIRIGFEIARRKNKRIPAANPDLASALVAGAMGAVVNKVMSNPLDLNERDNIANLMGQLVRELEKYISLKDWRSFDEAMSELRGVSATVGRTRMRSMEQTELYRMLNDRIRTGLMLARKAGYIGAWMRYETNGTKAGPYPFAAKQDQYAQYTIAQLLFAQRDAHAAAEAMRGTEAENWYRDDVSTISNEIRRRRELGGGGAPPGMKCHKCGGVAVFDRAEGFYCRPCFERMTQGNPARPVKRDEDGRVSAVKCYCGTWLELGGGGDEKCPNCGTLYNCFGQALRDPSEWEEPSEYENPGHTTSKTCAVCDKSYPYSWPWLSWEGFNICGQKCFASKEAAWREKDYSSMGGDVGECAVCGNYGRMKQGGKWYCAPCFDKTFYPERTNPTGVAFSGEKYYRPAKRIGGKIVRRRYRIMPEMPPIAGAHQEERKTHPVQRNPLLMTVMGANPAGPMPTDPGEAYHVAPEAHEAELSEMSQLSRFRGLRHAGGFAPTQAQCYAGVSTPGEPERITRLRQIAAGGIARCAACAPPSEAELEAGEWIRFGRKKHEDAPCAECVSKTTFEGAPLDPLSASVIVQTYDALRPNQREKFARLPLSMMDKMIGDWFLSKKNRPVLIGFILRASGGVMANPPPKTRLRSISAAMSNPKLAAKMNPGKRRKVTMPLEQFAAMVQKQGDPKVWANFVAKVKGYQKWTHGSMPESVTLETVDVPGVTGMWITYDMGREPEKLYVMPHGSKRKGAWRHPWEKMPHLKGDPSAGIMLTKTVAGNKITDFLHG